MIHVNMHTYQIWNNYLIYKKKIAVVILLLPEISL